MGAMVLVVVIASIALIFRGRAFSFPAGGPEMKRFWNERSFQRGGWLREEKEEQVSGDFTTVEIRNIAGGIDIQGPTPGNDTGSNVGIHAVKTAMFPAAMENLNVAIEKRGDRLLIEERHAGGFVMSAGTVSFVITLPRGIKTIEAHSVSGSVTVRGVGAGIDQNLSTISGSIETTGARNLDASSTSGSVQFVFAGSRLDAHTVSGSIEGRIESLDQGGSVSVRTVSGGVGLDAPSGLDAVVSLHSVSGGISCELPLAATEQRRNWLEGRIGSGSGRMDVTTTSGQITVRKL